MDVKSDGKNVQLLGDDLERPLTVKVERWEPALP